MMKFSFSCFVIALLALPGLAEAATYSYWGRSYDGSYSYKEGDTRMLARETGESLKSFGSRSRIHGYFILPTVLAPNRTVTLSREDLTRFSFSDGLYTYGEGSLRGPDDNIDLRLTTDTEGNIVNWEIDLFEPDLPFGDYSYAYASNTASYARFERILPGWNTFAQFEARAYGDGGGIWFNGALPDKEVLQVLTGEVPVPAPALLLLAGIGMICGLKRYRRSV